MTLTNSQYIEIAEKVWKIKWPDYWHKQALLEEEVNSWSGFGRTVEAMAGRGWDLGVDDGVVLFQRDHGNQFYESFYTVSPFNEEQFIEATHLAALEALEDDKS